MKNGMMDVGIFCREPRFGISTEKGRVPKKHLGAPRARQFQINTPARIYDSALFSFSTENCVLLSQTAASPNS